VTHVFRYELNVDYATARQGDGIAIVDTEGRRYLDAAGGAAVSCLGHSHPAVIAAMKAQLDRIAFPYRGFLTNEPMEALADELAAAARDELGPVGARGARALDYVFFVSGGSEAVEAALKLARQYFIEKGETQRRYVIGRRQSYHGNTLGALGAGGNAMRRAPYAPLLADAFRHVAPCYPYRDRRSDESEAAYGRRIADEIEAAIGELGAGAVMAVILEPVAGATLGCVPPVELYLARVAAICRRHGVLLIHDEVMCGMGRTGHRFASAPEGAAPDMVCLAKGLGGGYAPIGALMVTAEIHDTIKRGSGFFMHGHTYQGHALAAAAALAVQRAIRDENLIDNVRAMGDRLAERLTERFGNHRHVGDMRGRGLFRALEFVADRASKEPFAPERRLSQRLKAAGLARGLIVYPMNGTIDGRRGDHVILAPPYNVAPGEIDEIVRRLGDAVDAALAEVAR
jgi:adenosylmethionine-8-amino-7-oxononanoate aminotransferase